MREEAALATVEQLLGVDLHRQYPVGGFRIDGYDSVNKVAYEIDEPEHKHNAEKDAERQQWIESRLGCTFVRIKV